MARFPAQKKGGGEEFTTAPRGKREKEIFLRRGKKEEGKPGRSTAYRRKKRPEGWELGEGQSAVLGLPEGEKKKKKGFLAILYAKKAWWPRNPATWE